MRRFGVAALAVLAATVIGCEDVAPPDARLTAVPACWRPFGQPEFPPLEPGHIGKGSIVLLSDRQDLRGAAMYDPEADRWQAYRVPKGAMVFADHPHVWYVREDGRGIYCNTSTGFRREFTDLPASDFVTPGRYLADMGTRPLARMAGGKWWAWRKDLAAYAVLDPADGLWRPLPTDGLPKSLAVLAAAETDGWTWLTLGPDAYCVMRLPPEPTFALDKSAGQWIDMQTSSRWLLAAEGGVWMWDRLGESVRFWDSAKRSFTITMAEAYHLVPVGGRLWGLSAEDRGLVAVESVDPATGEPKPKLAAGARPQTRHLPTFDGRYLWSWPQPMTGMVSCYDPVTRKAQEFPVVRAVVDRVGDVVFDGSRIWFCQWRGSFWVYYDRRDDTWHPVGSYGGPPHRRGLASHPRYGAKEAVIDGHACRIERRRFVCRDDRTGDEVSYAISSRLQWPNTITPDALVFLVRARHAAVLLDKKTGDLIPLGPQLREGLKLRYATCHGDELWFTWADQLRTYPRQDKVRHHGAAVLNLVTRELTVWGSGELASRVQPLTFDDRRRWGVRGTTLVVEDRRTGMWTGLDYLGDRIWFDADYAYANVAGRLHRARKDELLATLAPPVEAAD